MLKCTVFKPSTEWNNPACILFPGEGIQNDILFQQDGAPAHYGREVVNDLNHEFPGRWIDRRGSIEWPPRSPDLNPLDFFLWGYLKWKVYKDRPRDLEEIKWRIRQEMQMICPKALLETLNNFKHRLIQWGHFEHLLHWNEHVLQHSTTNFGFNVFSWFKFHVL